MSDEISPGRKVYRRRRKYQGASWTPPSMSAEPTEGCWCRRCKQRHGYMSCKVSYDFGDKVPTLLWLCPNFGHVIGELKLDAKAKSESEGSEGTEGKPAEASPDEGDAQEAGS